MNAFRRASLLLVVVLGCAAALSACAVKPSSHILTPGGPDGSSATAQPAIPGVTPADVQFAEQMFVHHQQGVELAKMAQKQVPDAAIQTVVARIIDVQSAESRFLTTWLAGVAPEYKGSHSHAEMKGMVTASDMASFATLTGRAARTEFLRLMILHHQGAIDMANVRLGTAGTGTMTTFARSVAVEQSIEIDRLRELAATK